MLISEDTMRCFISAFSLFLFVSPLPELPSLKADKSSMVLFCSKITKRQCPWEELHSCSVSCLVLPLFSQINITLVIHCIYISSPFFRTNREIFETSEFKIKCQQFSFLSVHDDKNDWLQSFMRHSSGGLRDGRTGQLSRALRCR